MAVDQTNIAASPAEQYGVLLRQWIQAPDDAILDAAYSLGERLCAARYGLLETAALHQLALSQILSEQPVEDAPDLVASAQALQLECLKPFDVIDHRQQSADALRHLNQRLEEKIKSIAHALHDEAGQLLASVYLNVAEIASELPHRGRRRLEELRARLDQVDDQLRRLAHELRPSILDDLGLVPACQFLAEGVSRRSGMTVTVHGDDTTGRLGTDVETALYRVVQEALTNATRHGHAQHITVAFERSAHALRGSVRDDGSGFDVPAVLKRTQTRGLGLMGMRERVVAVGGTLTIISTPGSGTSVEFEVPTTES